MAEELPLWKKELNPGAPVFKVYGESNTVKARREMAVKALDYVELLRPLLENTSHYADCAVFYPESIDKENIYAAHAVDNILGLYELFNAATVPLRVIDKIPTSAEEQKLIVLNSVGSFSDGNCRKLEQYLASGGKVMLVGKNCEEIERIAGVAVVESDALFVQSELSNEYNQCYMRLPSKGRHYTETNGVPLLRYDNGEAAITKTDNVIYFGMVDEIDRFCYCRDFSLASWLKHYFTAENFCSGIEFHNIYVKEQDRHQYVSCDIFENDEKKILFIRNFGVDQRNSSVSWNLSENLQITKAWADGTEFKFKNGGELPPFEHFVVIYAEKRR